MVSEEEMALEEEGNCHHQLVSGLELPPPGCGGTVASVTGMLNRGHVGGKQGNMQHPRSEFEFTHVAIDARVLP